MEGEDKKERERERERESARWWWLWWWIGGKGLLATVAVIFILHIYELLLDGNSRSHAILSEQYKFVSWQANPALWMIRYAINSFFITSV